MSGRRIVIALVLVGVATVGGTRHGWSQSAPEPIAVQATPAKAATVHPLLTAAGTLISPEETKIASAVGGRLVSLHFRPGQSVKKGDVLARLRADTALAALKAAESVRANAEAVLLHDEKLLPLGGVSTEQSLNDASLLDAAEAHVTQAKEQVAETEIRAPYAGVVGFRDVTVGAFVSAGEAITDIRRMDPLLLQIAVPQVEVEKIRVGLPAEISVRGFCGNVSGRIVAIGPSLDPAQHSLRVQVQIPNSGDRLKPGMFATARVVLAGAKQALLIPEQAVSPAGGSTFVWTIGADQTVQRVAVVLGNFRDGKVEVLDGLQPSSMVITAGMQKLREGSKVKVDKYQPLHNPDLRPDRAGCTADR